MIASLAHVDVEFLLAVLWSVICFGAGVSWAAYRAIGWVERMRAWARSAQIEDEVPS